MYQRPQKIHEHHESWRAGCAIWGSSVALLVTMLWYPFLPTLTMGSRDDGGAIWVKSQSVREWMIVRGLELLIVVLSCVLLRSGRARRWTGRRSILRVLALAAIVLVWFWWGGIVVAGWS